MTQNEPHKHTPKPWIRWSEENCDGTKVSICHVANENDPLEDDNQHVCVATARGATSEVTEANAALIAAAPELYEALIALRREPWVLPKPLVDKINAAIAKAEGAA